MEGLSRTDQRRATSYSYLLTNIGGWQYIATTNAAFYMDVTVSAGVTSCCCFLTILPGVLL